MTAPPRRPGNSSVTPHVTALVSLPESPPDSAPPSPAGTLDETLPSFSAASHRQFESLSSQRLCLGGRSRRSRAGAERLREA